MPDLLFFLQNWFQEQSQFYFHMLCGKFWFDMVLLFVCIFSSQNIIHRIFEHMAAINIQDGSIRRRTSTIFRKNAVSMFYFWFFIRWDLFFPYCILSICGQEKKLSFLNTKVFCFSIRISIKEFLSGWLLKNSISSFFTIFVIMSIRAERCNSRNAYGRVGRDS